MATGVCFEGYGEKFFLTIMFFLIEFSQYHCVIKKTHHRICLRKFIFKCYPNQENTERNKKYDCLM